MSRSVVLFKAPKVTDTDGDTAEDKFVTYLGQVGVMSEVVGVLAFEFTSLDTLREALALSEEYEGVVLSSPRCVESVRRCFEVTGSTEVNLKVTWSSKRLFCVGPSTRVALLELLQIDASDSPSNVITSAAGNAQDLGRVIVEDFGKRPYALPLIIPGGNLQSDTLPSCLQSASIPFKHFETYRTIPNPNLARDLEKLENDTVTRRIFVFFSPSGIKFTLPHLRHFQLEAIDFIAIGPSTRAALENVSAFDATRIHQCTNPTPEALSAVIQNLLDVP